MNCTQLFWRPAIKVSAALRICSGHRKSQDQCACRSHAAFRMFGLHSEILRAQTGKGKSASENAALRRPSSETTVISKSKRR